MIAYFNMYSLIVESLSTRKTNASTVFGLDFQALGRKQVMTAYIKSRLRALSAQEREAQVALDEANARSREAWESLQDALAVVAALRYRREQLTR